MILLFSALAAAYPVDMTAITDTTGRRYVGFAAADGTPTELPVLTFDVYGDYATDTITFRVDSLTVTWLGDASAVQELRIWEDTDGDARWTTADTLVDTLLTVTEGEAYQWRHTGGYPIKTDDRRLFFVTAVLADGTADCAVLWAVIAAKSDVVLSDMAWIIDPVVQGSFPLTSVPDLAGADIVERTVQAYVATQPPAEVVVGYATGARYALQHCDGVPVDELAEPAEVWVGGVTTSLDTAPDWQGVFPLTWTAPTDAPGPYQFSLPADAVTLDGALGSVIVGPDAPVDSAWFDVVANPYAWEVVKLGSPDTGVVGETIPVWLRVRDVNGVAVSDADLEIAVIDGLQPQGTPSETSLVTDAEGDAALDFTLSTTVGANILRVEVPGTGASLNVALIGVPAAVSGDASLIDAPEFGIGDGQTPVTVTVRARDPSGNRISGAQVALSTTFGALAATAGTTNADGELVTTLVAPTEGLATVSATLDGVEIAPRTMVFRPDPVDGFWGGPYPNPVSAGEPLTVPFAVADDADVGIELFDATGVQVATLSQAPRARGYHEVTWETDELVHGAYVLRMEVDGELVGQTAVVVRSAGWVPCGCGTGTDAGLFLAPVVLVLVRRRRR